MKSFAFAATIAGALAAWNPQARDAASAIPSGYPAPGYPAPGYPVSGYQPPSYGSKTITEVLTTFTTYCPEATSVTYGGQTYTVTSATTLTITACPGGCHVTKTYPATATQIVTAVVGNTTTTCPVSAVPTPGAPAPPTSNPPTMGTPPTAGTPPSSPAGSPPSSPAGSPPSSPAGSPPSSPAGSPPSSPAGSPPSSPNSPAGSPPTSATNAGSQLVAGGASVALLAVAALFI